MVQKTSGLFDTVKASNMTVAGKASKQTAELDSLDLGETGFMPGMDLGSVFGDVPIELTEADYLDSFMDLSNFLNNEDSLKDTLPTVSSDLDLVKEAIMPTDFSGIMAQLKPELPVSMEIPEVTTSTKVSLGKRKRVDIVEKAMEEFITSGPESDVALESSIPDHDYVAKKLKMMAPGLAATSTFTATKTQPKPSTSTSKKSTDKYRERRDKNNEASRRSRQIRKQKFQEMDSEANELEVKNEALRKRITELEAMAKTMKAVLIKKMTEK